MFNNKRASFTIKRKKWILQRDGKKCLATFPHQCKNENLSVHHILPHAYINKVAPKVNADYPENMITLCRTAHEMIHPDVVWARNCYHLDNDIFTKLRTKRNALLDNHQIYWVDTWDRPMTVIALINTRKYIKKHQFPIYKPRKKL